MMLIWLGGLLFGLWWVWPHIEAMELTGDLVMALAWLIAGGAACAVGVPVVLVLWRRHRWKVVELDEARREMRAEVESIRELLQSRHLHN